MTVSWQFCMNFREFDPFLGKLIENDQRRMKYKMVLPVTNVVGERQTKVVGFELKRFVRL